MGVHLQLNTLNMLEKVLYQALWIYLTNSYNLEKSQKSSRPIHKKGKDPTLTTNYGGITVTSVLGKKIEYALLEKMPKLNNNQSDLQFGFTRGLSPIIGSLNSFRSNSTGKTTKIKSLFGKGTTI